jgi:ABC-type polysaccharide/polyol phosphate transport system ATPase subunit
MTSILLQNVSLYYPMRNKNISLRKKIIQTIFDNNIKENHIEALTNINLDIKNGIYGLYGPNGSGKTTLLKILAGIFEPTIGDVTINGSISSLINIHFGLNEELSGLENIQLKLLIQRIPSNEIKNLIIKISNDTKLGHYLTLPLKTYSSGMKFRLAFFITKYFKNDILLMDEWIATADEKLREEVDTIINKKIHSSDITIIASHNILRLKKICNKIFYMENGKIVQIV